MTHVFHRSLKADYPVAVAGDGPFIIDREGKRYFDGSGGAAVSCLGHSHKKVIQSIHAQIDRLAYAHSGFFTTEPMEELADFLIARAPEGLDRVYFVSGGSEAMEAAMKLARQYFTERGETGRTRFIARKQSYHGNTLGALSIGGNEWRREQFKPILIDATHLSPCYAYRGKEDGESDEAYVARLAAELEAHLETIDPRTVIAFVAEPVVGATLGAVPALPGYFRAIREILDRHGILLILDEVMCGMGRTGRLFACEEDGVAPDILAIAKGLGAGYQPIGAMLASRTIVETIRAGSGMFQHGHTYMGHATACAAAIAVQKTIEEEDLLENVRDKGAKLEAALLDRLGNHHHVGDIRGRGLFRGIEIVKDRATKEPFDPSLKIHARIKSHAMDNGLMCYPMGGTIDGRRGDHVLLAPPFIIENEHVELIAGVLGDTVDAVTSMA
jgi:adenosylmethionine-8-amino-7-oxononanoate aminotransferase